MKFGAIDIGSNAVRLLIGDVQENEPHPVIKKISLTRVPIRLGEDVFTEGKLSEEKIKNLVKTMKAFRHLIEVHECISYRACATSAMREAKNNTQVVSKIKSESQIPIEIIDGSEEADLIFSNFFIQDFDLSKSYLFIDVGGGSTELTLLEEGKRVKAKSFKIGTVRMLKGQVNENIWEEINNWINDSLNGQQLSSIGTGGNINRLYKMSKKPYMTPITLEEIKLMYQKICAHSFEDRIRLLRMKPDRADVILPASDIYIRILEMAGIQDMYVPKIGLSDGIIYQLYLEHQKRSSSV